MVYCNSMQQLAFCWDVKSKYVNQCNQRLLLLTWWKVYHVTNLPKQMWGEEVVEVGLASFLRPLSPHSSVSESHWSNTCKVWESSQWQSHIINPPLRNMTCSVQLHHWPVQECIACMLCDNQMFYSILDKIIQYLWCIALAVIWFLPSWYYKRRVGRHQWGVLGWNHRPKIIGQQEGRPTTYVSYTPSTPHAALHPESSAVTHPQPLCRPAIMLQCPACVSLFCTTLHQCLSAVSLKATEYLFTLRVRLIFTHSSNLKRTQNSE